MGVDAIKPQGSAGTAHVGQTQAADPVAPPSKVEKIETPPAAKAEDGVDVLKKKLMSVSGRYVAPPPVTSDRTDLKDLIAKQRAVANVNGPSQPVTELGFPKGFAAGSPAAKSSVDVTSLKEAVADGSDKRIREAIIADPSLAKSLTPKEKGQALEAMRSGHTSPGDKHGMSIIVESCESKEELQKVINEASGKTPAGQKEFHKFDQEMTDFHPCLIANKLNPANTQLPDVPLTADQKSNAKLTSADDQMKAGDFDGATKTLQDLKKSDGSSDKRAMYPPDVDAHHSKGDRSYHLKPESMNESSNDIIDRKLRQVAQAKEMSGVMGKTVDPHNIGQVKEYFDKISIAKPPVATKDIQGKYGEYLRDFTAPADRTEWGATPPLGERGDPAKLQEMFKGALTPHDVTGRPALDCEGYAYLSSAIFKGNPRFDVVHASSEPHISTNVYEKGKTTGFSVNPMYKGTVTELEQAPPKTGKELATFKKLYPTIESQQDMLAKAYHLGKDDKAADDGTLVPGSTPVDGPMDANRDLAKTKGRSKPRKD